MEFSPAPLSPKARRKRIDSKLIQKALGEPPTPKDYLDGEDQQPDFEAPPSPEPKRRLRSDEQPDFEAPSPPKKQKGGVTDLEDQQPDYEAPPSPKQQRRPLPDIAELKRKEELKKRPLPIPPPRKSANEKKEKPIPPPKPTAARKEKPIPPPRPPQRLSNEPAKLKLPPHPDDYITMHETFCVMKNVPQDQLKDRDALIRKMADAFDIKEKDTETICNQVSEKIEKTRIMNEIEKHVLTCTRIINEFNEERKKYQSDVQATIQDEVDFLLGLLKNVKARYEDKNVNKEQFKQDLKSFQTCEKLVRMARDNLRRSSASTKNRRTMTSQELEEAKKKTEQKTIPNVPVAPVVQQPKPQQKTQPQPKPSPKVQEDPIWLQVLKALGLVPMK